MIDLLSLASPADPDYKYPYTIYRSHTLRKPLSGTNVRYTIAQFVDRLQEMACTPHVYAVKTDVPFFMPGASADGSHNADKVTAYGIPHLDCDDGDALALCDALSAAGIYHYWYESPTSSPDKPKTRVGIATSRELYGPNLIAEQAAIYSLLLRIAREYDPQGAYDDAASDVSRIFFVPARCLEAKPGVPCPDPYTRRSVILCPGPNVLNVEAMLAMNPPDPAALAAVPRGPGRPKSKAVQRGLGTASQSVLVDDDHKVTVRNKRTREVRTLRLADLNYDCYVVADCHSSDGGGAAFGGVNEYGQPFTHCAKCKITTRLRSQAGASAMRAAYERNRDRERERLEARNALLNPPEDAPPEWSHLTPEEQALADLASDPATADHVRADRERKAVLPKASKELLKALDECKAQAKGASQHAPRIATGDQCCLWADQVRNNVAMMNRVGCSSLKCERHGSFNRQLQAMNLWRLPTLRVRGATQGRPVIDETGVPLCERERVYVTVLPAKDDWDKDYLPFCKKVFDKHKDGDTDGYIAFRLNSEDARGAAAIACISTAPLKAPKKRWQPATTLDTSAVPAGQIPQAFVDACAADAPLVVEMTGKEAYRLFKEPTVRSMNPQQIEGVQDGYTVDTPEHPQTLHLTLRVYRESDNYTVTMGVHTSSKELREARERMYAQTESPVRVISAPAEEATPADASAVDAYVTATPVQPATIAFIFALHRRKSKRLLKAMAQRLAQEMEEQWEADEAQRETLNAALDAAM